MFGRNLFGTPDFQKKISQEEKMQRLKEELACADAVVLGAGAGLSTSAGFIYNGERFERYFADFREKYGFADMYSGGFYPYRKMETFWAYWSRYIYVNRYMDPPKRVYEALFELVKEKDYFVITTNVDHCFQKAGFDKKRLFYTQGDYGLFQCSEPCQEYTYDNEKIIKEMLVSQGFFFDEEGVLQAPCKADRSIDFSKIKMEIETALIPYCPHCGEPMSMNLRADDTFVQDEGWYQASDRYVDFLRRHQNLHVLYLELGVGGNTPAIIKYPFWQRLAENEKAVYACLNYGEAFCPENITDRSICLDGDIGAILAEVK